MCRSIAVCKNFLYIYIYIEIQISRLEEDIVFEIQKNILIPLFKIKNLCFKSYFDVIFYTDCSKFRKNILRRNHIIEISLQLLKLLNK